MMLATILFAAVVNAQRSGRTCTTSPTKQPPEVINTELELHGLPIIIDSPSVFDTVFRNP